LLGLRGKSNKQQSRQNRIKSHYVYIVRMTKITN
jgi:hypothetical protein